MTDPTRNRRRRASPGAGCHFPVEGRGRRPWSGRAAPSWEGRCAMALAASSVATIAGHRSWPATVHTLTRADAGRRRTVRTVGQTGDRMPDAHGRGRPSATRAGHRHAQPIQQAPQPHTASCAPAMLYTDAARMTRLVGDDHRATAPGTRGVSSGIHEDTVSPLHDRRERSPYARVLTPGGGAGPGVVFGYRACSAQLGRSGPRWRRQRHRAWWWQRNCAPELGGPQCHLPHQ
jgi:hypothetical protein